MKPARLLISLLLLCALPAMAMTDKQVISYIKTQSAAGKSQEQIGKELLAKGVTPDQIKRIKANYEKGQNESSTREEGTTSRLRKNTKEDSKSTNSRTDKNRNKKNSENDRDLKNADKERLNKDNYSEGLIFDNETKKEDDEDYLDFLDSEEFDFDQKIIYGHDVFGTRELTFEPNVNIATPPNYRLGPGDEVIIDIWGTSEDNIREEISPEGRIMISQLGPVYLNGMTVAEANRHIKNIFSKKYAGVGSDTDINLTLGNIRSIQIDVMGEVQTPGTFRLSPFSNVFHAIYNAGGINDIGSLRNIEVLRNGKKIATVDMYDFLFKGKDTGNVKLQEGDIIMVPAYSELVNIVGNVKRPMYYELKPTENIQNLLDYAGGFTGDAYSGVVRLERQNGIDKEIFTVDKGYFSTYTLKDGDVVTIGTVTDRFSNKVEAKGAFVRPGEYAISENIKTVKDLIKTAEGLDDNAYMERAIIYREKPDKSLEIMAFNLGKLMDGTIADIKLNKNDIIEIMDVNEITERGDLTIQGMVASPGNFPYMEGTTVEDLILQAGGLREGASTARVEVARRIVNQNATDATNALAEVFTFNLENGTGVGENKGFVLMPYDIVNIRKSPTYNQQELVTIDGQILYPGGYVLQSRNERISEVIKRAGGLLESAYVEGAYLKRKMSEEQKRQRDETIRLAKLNSSNEGDSINMEQLDLSDEYFVGINLKKAIDRPGSTYDVVMQKGDILFVPEHQSTVKISGEVLYPNTVVYVPGKKLKYYVEQAGGYKDQAKKSKSYIIYMNGSVAIAKGSSPIEPGCQIIVPSKPDTKFDWTKVLSIATSLGSLATMAASIVSITK